MTPICRCCHGVSAWLLAMALRKNKGSVVLQKGDLCPLVRGGGSKRNALVGSLGESNKLIKSLGGQRSC